MKVAIAVAVLNALAVVSCARAAAANVFTAEHIAVTLIDKSPFMVEVTSTITWTQSESIASSQPTTAPTPTLDPSYNT